MRCSKRSSRTYEAILVSIDARTHLINSMGHVDLREWRRKWRRNRRKWQLRRTAKSRRANGYFGPRDGPARGSNESAGYELPTRRVDQAARARGATASELEALVVQRTPEWHAVRRLVPGVHGGAELPAFTEPKTLAALHHGTGKAQPAPSEGGGVVPISPRLLHAGPVAARYTRWGGVRHHRRHSTLCPRGAHLSGRRCSPHSRGSGCRRHVPDCSSATASASPHGRSQRQRLTSGCFHRCWWRRDREERSSSSPPKNEALCSLQRVISSRKCRKQR